MPCDQASCQVPAASVSAGCQSSPSRVGLVDTLSIAIVPAVASVSDGRLTTTSRPSTSTGSRSVAPASSAAARTRSEVGVSGTTRSWGPFSSGTGSATKRWTRPRASRTVTIGASVDPSSSDRSTGSRVGSPVSGSVTILESSSIRTLVASRIRCEPSGSEVSGRSGRASASGANSVPRSVAVWSPRSETRPGAVAGSSASSSPLAAVVVTRTLCRSTGVAPSTPSIAAKAVSSVAGGSPLGPRTGTTRRSAPTRKSAWSACDWVHVEVYETANTPIDIASISRSAARV